MKENLASGKLVSASKQPAYPKCNWNEFIAFFENIDDKEGSINDEDVEEIFQDENNRKDAPGPTIKTKGPIKTTKSYIGLWKGQGVQTTIQGDRIKAGSVTTVTVGGNKQIRKVYFPNVQIPIVPHKVIKENIDFQGLENRGNSKVVIAVLDTGSNVPVEFLWTNKELVNNEPYSQNTEDTINHVHDGDFIGGKHGWNFVGESRSEDENEKDMQGNDIIIDDSDDKHGTLISYFIINEFKDSPNSVELMILKTHDKDGKGDLFSAIRAINFAIDKGVDIINASWGFYSLFDLMDPEAKKIITKRLEQKNILFITAAGNQDPDVDRKAKKKFKDKKNLRDLSILPFYPACWSDNSNNIITVTTAASKSEISASQNFSKIFVDLGIMAQEKGDGSLKVPFSKIGSTIEGSSYAAAIATGIIGAHWNSSWKEKGISKSQILQELTSDKNDVNKPFDAIPKLTEMIREGRCTRNIF